MVIMTTIRRIESNEPIKEGQQQFMEGLPLIDYYRIPGQKYGRWYVGVHVFEVFGYKEPSVSIQDFRRKLDSHDDRCMSSSYYDTKRQQRQRATFIHEDLILKHILPKSRKEAGQIWQEGERQAMDEYIDTGVVVAGQNTGEQLILFGRALSQKLEEIGTQLKLQDEENKRRDQKMLTIQQEFDNRPITPKELDEIGDLVHQVAEQKNIHVGIVWTMLHAHLKTDTPKTRRTRASLLLHKDVAPAKEYLIKCLPPAKQKQAKQKQAKIDKKWKRE
jgi:hypothetical protein